MLNLFHWLIVIIQNHLVMQLNITPLKSTKFLVYTLLASVLVSCGTYKSAYDDGIYASNEQKPEVIVAGSKEHKEYEENYFTSEVDRLDRINGTDILTDIDSYSSLQDEDDLIIESDTLEYTGNSGGSWDSGGNTTVIYINDGPYFGDVLWNRWRWNRWRWNRWRWNRFSLGGFEDPYYIGYGRYYNPAIYWNVGFYNGFYGGFYDPFCPPFYRYYTPFRGPRYFNNGYFRYGRRGAYLANNTRRFNTSRRNFAANTRRGFSTRRSTSTIRRNNSVRTRTRNTYTKPRTRTRDTYTKPRTRTRNTYTKPRTQTRNNYTKPRTRTRTRASAPSRTRSRSSSTRSSSRSRGTSRSRGRRG